MSKAKGKKTGRIPREPRSKTARLEDLDEIARLDRWGYTQVEIAKKVGVSQSRVSVELKRLRQMYNDSMFQQRCDAVAEKFVLIREVRAKALAAYELSCKDAEKVTVEEEEERPCAFCKGNKESMVGGKAVRCIPCAGRGMYRPPRRITTVIEKRMAANAYLATILDTIKQERDLLGLDEIKRVEMSGTIATVGVTMTFDELMRVAREKREAAAINSRLAQFDGRPALPAPNGDVVIETTCEEKVHVNGQCQPPVAG